MGIFFILMSGDCLSQFRSKFSAPFIPEGDKFVRAARNLSHTLLLFLFVNIFCCLQADLASGNTQEIPTSTQHIRVGIFNYYPIVFVKNGVPTGFHFELLKEVAKEEGWTLDIQHLDSLKNVLNGLESNTLDLGMGVVPTIERARFLDFTKENNALLKGQVFIRSERRDIQTINDLNKKTVAYINYDALGENFITICNKLGVAPVLKLTNSYDDLLAAIIAGDVDAGIFSDLQGARYSKSYSEIRSTPIVFKEMEVQFAVPKGRNKFIIDALDSHLGKWKKAEGSVYYKLIDEFLKTSSPQDKEISKRDLLIILCIYLLVVTFGIIMGRVMVKRIETGKVHYSRPYIRDIVLFTLSISLFFGVIDSLMVWSSFNEHNLTLLELTITNIPRQNLYIRGMFFLMCCFFGLFLAKYVGGYEEMYNILLTSVNRFERLTDNAKDMIFHMALPSGRYEYVSKASLHIFGYSPEEFLKKPLLIQDLVHPLWRKYYRSEWTNLLDGNTPAYFEYQIIHKNGEVRWVNQRNTLYLDESGIPNALEGIITDVTEQKIINEKGRDLEARPA